MKRIYLIFFVAFILIPSHSCTKRQYVDIKSNALRCKNGKSLNAGRWWTQPIPKPGNPDIFYECGGNAPGGKELDDCIAIDTGTCGLKKLRGRMETRRLDLRPVCIDDKCYLLGGNTSESNEKTRSVDILPLKKSRIGKTNLKLPEPRLCYAAVAIDDSRILVTGGYGVKDAKTGKGEVFNTALLIDAKTGDIKTIPMVHRRGGHSMVRLPDGLFLLTGGNGSDPNGAELFDPEDLKFIAIESKMKAGRKDHRSLLAMDGRIYIVGGSMGEKSPREVEVYDHIERKFSDTGLKICEGREDAEAVYIKQFNWIVLVGGEIKGSEGEPESKSIDVIDLDWKKVHSGTLATQRDEPSLVIQRVDEGNKKIRLLILNGQQKDKDGKEISLPVEEVLISK